MNVHIGMKLETFQKDLHVQDVEESNMIKSFQFECLTTIWTKQECKPSIIKSKRMYNDLEDEKQHTQQEYEKENNINVGCASYCLYLLIKSFILLGVCWYIVNSSVYGVNPMIFLLIVFSHFVERSWS